MKSNVMSATLMAALAATGFAGAAGAAETGEYLSGDFHNHTTCSDGSSSVQALTSKSLEYLDWFVHVGHSGRGSRNCNISDFLYLNRDSEFNRGLWVNSLPNGAADIKGDPTTETMRTGTQVPAMWRWQSLQEHNLGGIVEERNKAENKDKTAFVGLEWVVPGHEHTSTAISTGQYDAEPQADAIAQFEYCFGRNSEDTSQGGGQGWTCELSEEANNKLIALFDGRPEEGTADYNSTLVGGINIEDQGEHVKSAAGVLWQQENFPGEAAVVQAHVERAGSFLPGSDRGFNVEHMRDWNSLAPDVAFGFESQPGHQASRTRGGYSASRPTAGLYTYGGTGCYAAAETARPGMKLDGSPLTAADFLEGGDYEDVRDNQDPAFVTVCQPGVRTMWDAMLSEGRKFWFFASSDWHNRGIFGPLDQESTLDFWPGEYQENFTVLDQSGAVDEGKAVIDSLRSGNSFTVQGGLINRDFLFEVCSRSECAGMGETLEVSKGQLVEVRLVVNDPKGTNNSVYAFDNPALLQIGKQVPLNKPELAQVDLIAGAVTGQIAPTDPAYFNPLAPDTTRIVKTWMQSDRGVRSRLAERIRGALGRNDAVKYEMRHRMKIDGDSYVRARGSNLPAGTPFKRDEAGNPLRDDLSDMIPCNDAACPSHIEGILDADVEAWADVWFHSNPVFIKVVGS